MITKAENRLGIFNARLHMSIICLRRAEDTNMSDNKRNTLLVFFALAFGISWSVWFVMRAAAIQPTLGPNFSTSPGYLLLAFGIAGPTWAALLVTSFGRGKEDRRDLLRRFLRWRLHWGWYLLALGLPLLLALAAAGLYN